jgi:serine/threonine-protein kinase RsbW
MSTITDEGKKIELYIPSIMGFEKVAMECAASIAKIMGFNDDRIDDLKTAVSEACLNAIEHGHGMNASLKVGITITMAESSLQVAVHDKGGGIGQIDLPVIENKIEDESNTRGWGIFLIKNLMDEVKFEKTAEGKNVVRMIINLKKRSEGQGSDIPEKS